MTLAWGTKVSAEFRALVLSMAQDLDVDASWLMACMAFETGDSFSPSVRNQAGSGAVGLIQFMPSTCAALGVTVEDAVAMTAEAQLHLVWLYFAHWKNRLHNLGDVYGAILWPGMVGKPDNYVLFDQHDLHRPQLYIQNKGLDFNKDGKITRAEVVMRVQARLDRGLCPPLVFTGTAMA